MNNCDCCFNDFLAKCETEIVINTNLTAGDSYRWVITNKFGNKYEGTAIAGEEGELTIPVEDLPAGMFTQYSADFLLHLYAGESCTPIKFKLTGEYDCVNFNIHGGTFVKNNIGCTTTFVPGGQTFDSVLAAGGDLTEERIIDINGHDFYINNGASELWFIDLTGSESGPYQQILSPNNNMSIGLFDNGDIYYVGLLHEFEGAANFDSDVVFEQDVTIQQNTEIGGTVLMTGLPTDDPFEAGALWNDSGTIKISSG